MSSPVSYESWVWQNALYPVSIIYANYVVLLHETVLAFSMMQYWCCWNMHNCPIGDGLRGLLVLCFFVYVLTELSENGYSYCHKIQHIS